jgi:hypothetical protein
MSGGGGGVIILKNLKTAAQLSVSPSGKYKVWHLVLLSHALNGLGWLF